MDNRVSCPILNPISAMVRPPENFWLYKFGQLYINKPISYNQCQVAQVLTNWPEENINECPKI